MGNPQPWPLFLVEDINGKPVSGAKIYTYEPNSTTDKTTYSNYLRTSANANPVITDSRGEAIIYLAGPTKFVITDAADVAIKTIAWVSDGATNIYEATAYGTPGSLAAITAALADIGSDNATLFLDAESWAINPTGATYTIPANVNLQVAAGGTFAMSNGKTLIIKGPIDAVDMLLFTVTGSGKPDLSYSLTDRLPLEWFGGVADPLNGPYTQDNAAALTMVLAARGYHQTIKINQGVWRIVTPVVQALATFLPNLLIKGDSFWTSLVYIDMGGSDIGITIGSLTADTFDMRMEDISFVGPETCCLSALKLIRAHHSILDRVNFWLGSTGYALDVEGCLFLQGDIRVRDLTLGYANWASVPYNGINISSTITPYQSNAVDIKVQISDVGNIGLNLDGTNYPMVDNKITGAIEGFAGNPLQATYCNILDLSNLYIEGPLTAGHDVVISNCNKVKMGPTLWTCHNVNLINCRGTEIDRGQFDGILTIDPDCRGTVLKNITVWNLDSPIAALNDHAPDTQYIGDCTFPHGLGVGGIYNSPGHDAKNFIYNSSMSRFQTDRPDGGWGSPTQLTISQEASVVHRAPYSAKMVTNGGDGAISLIFDADQLKALLGQYVNFTTWINVKAAQTITSYPYMTFTVTVPTWVLNTVYKIGDAAKASPNSSLNFIAVQAGTSGGTQPTWPIVQGGRVTDGGVIWVAEDQITSNSGTPLVAADGLWHEIRLDNLIPNNATAAQLDLYVAQQSVGGPDETTIYFAEPCLFIGNRGPRGLVGSVGEFQNYIQVGANQYFNAASIPTSGFNLKGDICWNTDPSVDVSGMILLGWIRLTTGTAHSSGTDWELMYVSKNSPVT